MNKELALANMAEKGLTIGGSEDLFVPENFDGFLPGLKFGWPIQNLDEVNKWYIDKGQGEDDDLKDWLKKPFKVSVIFSKPLLRKVVTDEEGAVTYLTGKQGSELYNQLLEERETNPAIQIGATYVVSVLIGKKCYISDLTLTKSMYKALYLPLKKAGIDENMAMEVNPDWSKTTSKTKKGFTYPDSKKIATKLKIGGLNKDELALIYAAVTDSANVSKINAWSNN